MFFFQIKFHLELTHPNNSHNFSWLMLTWEEGRLRKGELSASYIKYIWSGNFGRSWRNGRIFTGRKKKTQSTFLWDDKLQWEGRFVTLCHLFCVMKMCWCHGSSYPSLLDFVTKRRALPLCLPGQKLPEIFCSSSAGAVIAGCAQSMHPTPTHANQQFKCWYSWWFNSSDFPVAEFQALYRLHSDLQPACMHFYLYPLFSQAFSISFKEMWNSGN